MMKKMRNRIAVLLVLILIIPAGCKTALAPEYDRAVVTGLTSVNNALLVFFASVSDGTTKETYAERRDKYSSLIGTVEALEIQANARPVPDNIAVEKINKYLTSRSIPEIDLKSIPSANALSEISEALVKMRDTDKKQGVTVLEVKLFKSQVSIFLDQALTYENFLER